MRGKYDPILIFAEGLTSNGRFLGPFKRGAFEAEKAILPVYMKFSHGGFSTDCSTMDYLPLIIFNMSWLWGGLTCELCVMPIFEPNEYMFYKFKEAHGSSRWQIYAWCLRDAMAKCGQFKVSDVPARAKLAYYGYMNGSINIQNFGDKSIDEIVKEYNEIKEKKTK